MRQRARPGGCWQPLDSGPWGAARSRVWLCALSPLPSPPVGNRTAEILCYPKSARKPKRCWAPSHTPSPDSPWSWRPLYRSLALVGCARAVLSHFGCSYLRVEEGKRRAGSRLRNGVFLNFSHSHPAVGAHTWPRPHITAP